MPRVAIFRIKRELSVTPRRDSSSKEKAIIELINAATVNANKGRKVAGNCRLNKRGRMTIKNMMINGYMARGLTRVLPPIPDGKKGKLVTGKVKKNNPQKIMMNLSSENADSQLFIHTPIYE